MAVSLETFYVTVNAEGFVFGRLLLAVGLSLETLSEIVDIQGRCIQACGVLLGNHDPEAECRATGLT